MTSDKVVGVQEKSHILGETEQTPPEIPPILVDMYVKLMWKTEFLFSSKYP